MFINRQAQLERGPLAPSYNPMADNQHASGSALPLTGFIPFPPGQTTRYGNADSPPPSVDVQPPTPGLPAGDSGDAFVRDHYEGASTDGMFGRFEYQLGMFIPSKGEVSG